MRKAGETWDCHGKHQHFVSLHHTKRRNREGQMSCGGSETLSGAPFLFYSALKLLSIPTDFGGKDARFFIYMAVSNLAKKEQSKQTNKKV